jgi:hypothetical protein
MVFAVVTAPALAHDRRRCIRRTVRSRPVSAVQNTPADGRSSPKNCTTPGAGPVVVRTRVLQALNTFSARPRTALKCVSTPSVAYGRMRPSLGGRHPRLLVTSCLPVQQPYPEPETGLGTPQGGDVRDGGSGAALSALADTHYIVRFMRGLDCPRLAKNEAVTTMEAHGRAVVDAPVSSALCFGSDRVSYRSGRRA